VSSNSKPLSDILITLQQTSLHTVTVTRYYAVPGGLFDIVGLCSSFGCWHQQLSLPRRPVVRRHAVALPCQRRQSSPPSPQSKRTRHGEALQAAISTCMSSIPFSTQLSKLILIVYACSATFLATLFLLLFGSCCIVVRSYMMRRRFRRHIQEMFLADGTGSTHARCRCRKRRPKFYDRWIVPAAGSSWADIMVCNFFSCFSSLFFFFLESIKITPILSQPLSLRVVFWQTFFKIRRNETRA